MVYQNKQLEDPSGAQSFAGVGAEDVDIDMYVYYNAGGKKPKTSHPTETANAYFKEIVSVSQDTGGCAWSSAIPLLISFQQKSTLGSGRPPGAKIVIRVLHTVHMLTLESLTRPHISSKYSNLRYIQTSKFLSDPY